MTKEYSKEELNEACRISLEHLYSPRYRQIKAILTNPVYQDQLTQEPLKQEENQGYIRGAEYYGGGEND